MTTRAPAQHRLRMRLAYAQGTDHSTTRVSFELSGWQPGQDFYDGELSLSAAYGTRGLEVGREYEVVLRLVEEEE